MTKNGSYKKRLLSYKLYLVFSQNVGPTFEFEREWRPFEFESLPFESAYFASQAPSLPWTMRARKRTKTWAIETRPCSYCLHYSAEK